MVEVTIDETQFCKLFFKATKDLCKIAGKYEDVLHYPNNENDFVAVELLDKMSLVKDLYDFLKENFIYYTYQSF